jgi:hypothetical protein
MIINMETFSIYSNKDFIIMKIYNNKKGKNRKQAALNSVTQVLKAVHG